MTVAAAAAWGRLQCLPKQERSSGLPSIAAFSALKGARKHIGLDPIGVISSGALLIGICEKEAEQARDAIRTVGPTQIPFSL